VILCNCMNNSIIIVCLCVCCMNFKPDRLLAHAFTYHVFWGVTAIQALYLVVSDFLSGKSLLLGHNI